VTSAAGRWLSHPAVGAACRLALGGVFMYAAFGKLTHPAEMARLINGYRLLHPDLANLAGIVLPWVELVAGALLALGVVPQSAALVLAGLLALFMGAGFLALVRGLEISCGCFFPFLGGERLSWTLFPRDGVLLLLALQVLAWPSSFLPARASDGGEIDG
jgi:putative oxidoreductase